MKKKKINTSKFITLLSVIFMMIIFAYILLNSNLFNSSNIKIEGNNKVSKKEIISILDIKQDKNIFMYNIKDMEKSLIENKYIETVKIKRGIPNKLHILIIEKEIAAILDNDLNYCYIDKYGNLIQEFNKSDNIDKGMIVKINYKLTEDKTIDFENEESEKRLLYLLEYIKKDNLYKKINVIDFNNKDLIEIYTKDKIKVILPINDKMDYNIAMMTSILADLQGKNKNGGSIDFTLGDNPIYKP